MRERWVGYLRGVAEPVLVNLAAGTLYGSFVIHPMMLDGLDVCAEQHQAWPALKKKEEARATRYAAVLERMTGPDGSFPPIGRSIAYRCGAFHALAQAAWRNALPSDVAPAQVREALTAVIARSLDARRRSNATGGCASASAVISRAPASATSRPGACISAHARCCRSDCRRPTPSGRTRPVDWTAKRAWAGRAFPIDRAMQEL